MVVIFDIGSTLIEGPPFGPARRLSEMLEVGADAIPMLEQLLFRAPSKSAAELAGFIAKELGIESGKALAACTTLWNAQLEEAFVLPGAQETIAALRAARIKRAYLSNIWPPFYECFRREFAKEADRPQILSFRSGRMKPDRAFFEEVVGAAGTSPEHMLMVGDTYKNDIAPAIELGMRTAWVLHRPQKEQAALVKVLNQEDPSPDVTLSSISELTPELVRSLLGSSEPTTGKTHTNKS